jgi:hypothetical protein
MEIIFPKSLARPWRWVRFPLPNENWALWRVWAMLINSCVIASPADILSAFERMVQAYLAPSSARISGSIRNDAVLLIPVFV